MLRVRALASLLAVSLVLLATCHGKSKKPIIVGGKSSTDQTIVGEIIAQHLENRLKRPVQRNLNIGATQVVYQTLVGGQLTLYPEYTGNIEAEILKEQAPVDTQMMFERSKGELARLAQLELLPTLGYENPPTVAIRSTDAQKYKLTTLSEAAESPVKWKIAVSYEFQQRKDAIPAITTYKLPMASGIRGTETGQLFSALEKNEVNMIAADATDSRLSSPNVTVLADDKKSFPAYQACILVRQDALMDEPLLRPALQELSGKLSLDQIRRMSAQMDQEHKPVAEIAQAFPGLRRPEIGPFRVSIPPIQIAFRAIQCFFEESASVSLRETIVTYKLELHAIRTLAIDLRPGPGRTFWGPNPGVFHLSGPELRGSPPGRDCSSTFIPAR